MVLLVLAYLGGVLTIVSPCILPVLPFVFARADRPFRRSGLPLLAGMALTFAGVASIAVLGGSWVVRANQYGRIAALIILALFGLTLLSSSLAERLARPLVRLGNRLTQSSSTDAGSGALQSFLLGIATGLLWAPCAGPILGLVLTGAAIQGASAHTSLLLFAYAAGAATSLAVALLAGGRVFAAMKRSLGAEVWIRRVLGVAVLIGVAAVAFGVDRGVLTRLSLASTSGIEQKLIDDLHPQRPGQPTTATATSPDAAGGQRLPDLSGATAWINSPPLNRDQLKGKVVLIDFWTYSCINCLRTLPYVNAWAQKYKDSGLVVIGVHTPEFPFEKDLGNVQKAMRELGITYPVALDNNYKIWNGFSNEYWPAHYFIDATGKIRFHHFGEGGYDESEKWIQDLLKERNGQQSLPQGIVAVSATGAEAAPDTEAIASPETYLGYERAQHFASAGGLNQDDAQLYTAPKHLQLNQWALSGNWTDHGQIAVLNSTPGKILFRFQARDLHLVLGPTADGKPVRFRIKIDGRAPGENHGIDADEQGNGVVKEDRLYQLVRQKGSIADHTFEIEFLDPGVQAFAFTFG
ncbi:MULTISPECIES: cytochrome c biogenesis protein DipZ [Acidobacteriaceae]|uniref:cytochrome c biogenesis protein DipZ n=1 Tax=Acidobacteriaceae TaxID=204434 RepID=UPI00131D3486|nr:MULTISPECIES: cytochrome c biogenesis protein DipZ [Acidobacteriaceae]MDW5265671.1 cytochrome c biogenesis protein DipZ [Edaphobacter sp.]